VGGPVAVIKSLVCIVVFILYTTNHYRDQFFKLGKTTLQANPFFFFSTCVTCGKYTSCTFKQYVLFVITYLYQFFYLFKIWSCKSIIYYYYWVFWSWI